MISNCRKSIASPVYYRNPEVLVDFELSNFDDDYTKGRSKVQLNDDALHRLTAYKSAPYKHNFKIKLLQ